MIALNAKTGDEYWRYKRQLPDDLFQLHPTSRGVGLWQDKLYLATTDDHVVALDARTGKVLWDSKVQDYKKGQYLTLMPLIVDGKVIISVPAANSACAAMSSRSTPMTARNCGGPSPFPAKANPATTPGAATIGSRVADRRG